MEDIEVVAHPRPTPEEEITRVLEDPGFGTRFTDHTVAVDWTAEAGWTRARLEPYGPIALDPAASVLHYAAEIFEGVKAYRHRDGGVCTFRPEMNAARLNASARRMALPELGERLFLASLEALVTADRSWVPRRNGASLYLRPFMFSTEPFLGVRPPRSVSYRVIASPVADLYDQGRTPMRIWVSRDYARAAPGGTGAAKTGGNYAGSVAALTQATARGCHQALFLDAVEGRFVEELGGMNVFLVTAEGKLLTSALSGTILEGITRSSIIQLARERGLQVEQRRITLQEWTEGAADGGITEAFACGTAAAVAPIGQIVDGEETITMPGDFSTTLSLREELTGIQNGTIEDRHGWLHRLT